MNLRRHRLTGQRQEIDLRVACEDQTRVQVTVDPGGFVGIATVQAKPTLTQPGDRPHDAIRFKDADAPVGTECCWHRAERIGIEKGLSLVQLAFEPRMATHFSGAGFLTKSDWMRIEVPKPGPKLFGRCTPYFNIDARQTRGNCGLPDSGIR